MSIKKPSAVDSPYVTTDTTPTRLVAAPVAGGGVSTVVAAVANTVSASANTDTAAPSTGSNVSYYTSGIEGIAGLANYGRVFDGANVYVTLEQQQYNTYNQTIGIGNSISVTGNITTSNGYFIGNGSQLTGISASANKILNGNSYANIASANGSLVIGINGGNAWTFNSQSTLSAPGGSSWRNQANADAYFASSLDGYVHLQSLFADGNVGSEVFLEHGLLTLTAHSVGANADYTWTFDNGGNLTLPGNTFQINYANGTPASLGSAYGNANVVANLSALGSNPVSTTGNVTAGNIRTTGLITATGNITSGNILTAGLISATGNITGGNINSPRLNNSGNISVVSSGNTWTFNNNTLIAPGGSQWRNQANADAYFASSANGYVHLQSLFADGNIGSEVFLEHGLMQITAHSLGANTDYVWTFDNGGNLTLPGNTFQINYANGTPASLGSTYGNANVVANLAALGSNPVSTTGNVTSGNLLTGGLISATSTITSAANIVGGNLRTGGLISATANITGGNILTGGLVSATGNVTGNYFVGDIQGTTGDILNVGTTNLTVTNISAPNPGNAINIGAGGNNNIVVSNVLVQVQNVPLSVAGNVTGGNLITAGLVSTTGNVQAGNVRTAGLVSATGNIVTAGNFVGNGAALTNVTVNVAGNIIGTQSNVALVAGAYSTVIDNTGNLTLPGNTFAVNYANNTPVDVVTRFESTWTVPVGNSTQSFTVPINNMYQLWINGNIPNGIIVYNATVSVSNTNVPVIGQQFAWNYEGGGNILMFTSIPAQIIGTAGAIANAQPAVANTNVFSFGINNTSGGNVTVSYGWIQIS